MLTLYEEARSVLDESNLEAIIRGFGSTRLEGSYLYRTMVDRDIDFTVTLSDGRELSLETRSDIAAELTKILSRRIVKQRWTLSS